MIPSSLNGYVIMNLKKYTSDGNFLTPPLLNIFVVVDYLNSYYILLIFLFYRERNLKCFCLTQIVNYPAQIKEMTDAPPPHSGL